MHLRALRVGACCRRRQRRACMLGLWLWLGLWSFVPPAAGAQPAAPSGSNQGAAALPDWAPKPPPQIVEDRLRVELTLLGAAVDTRLRVDPSLTQPGTAFNAEDDLGLDDARLLALGEITLLPGERHLLRLSGLSLRRTAQALLQRQIVFDDQTYLAGERVDSALNLAMFGITYGYRFIVRERAELAATLGVQVLELEANAVVRSRVVRDAESAVAPLPLLGLEGRLNLDTRWSLEGRVQYLQADIDQVDGSMLDARLALARRLNPYFVLGLGYRLFDIDIDSRDEGTPGRVKMTVDGPQLFVRASL